MPSPKNKPDNIEDSHLIKRLKSLTPEEFKTLGKFVKSPYFNTSENNLKLYEWLKPHYPDFQHLKLEREHIHQHIRPTKKYQRKYVNDRVSDFIQLVDKFFIIEQVEHNQRLQQKQLLQAYQRRELSPYFFPKSLNLIEQIEQQDQQSWKDFFDLWQLYEGLYTHPENKKFTVGKGDYAPKMIANFEISYLINALTQACTTLARNKSFQTKTEISMLYSLQNKAEKYQETSIVLKLYLYFTKLWENHQDELFEELWQICRTQFDKIAKSERINLLHQFTNISANQVKLGYSSYIGHAFEAMKLGVEKRVYLHHLRFSAFTFLNIVITGALQGEFEWTTKFIEHHLGFLQPDKQEDTECISRVYLDFYQQQYEQVIVRIAKSFAKDEALHVRLKSFEVMSYYELWCVHIKDIHFLKNSLKALDIATKRNDIISQSWKKSYQNFCSFINKLIKVRQQKVTTPSSKQQLLEEINLLQPIVHKKWLMSKVDEL